MLHLLHESQINLDDHPAFNKYVERNEFDTMPATLIYQLDFNRKYLMNVLKGTTEYESRLIPTGFDTNILWNVGQIFTVMEESLFVFMKMSELPTGYADLFSPQTKPGLWQDVKPPKFEVLVAQLEEQTHRIKQTFENRLDERLVPPYKLHSGFELETIGEVLGFAHYHNAVRTGFIEALRSSITTLATS